MSIEDKVISIISATYALQDYGNARLIKEVLQELLDRVKALEALAH